MSRSQILLQWTSLYSRLAQLSADTKLHYQDLTTLILRHCDNFHTFVVREITVGRAIARMWSTAVYKRSADRVSGSVYLHQSIDRCIAVVPPTVAGYTFGVQM